MNVGRYSDFWLQAYRLAFPGCTPSGSMRFRIQLQ